MSMVVCVCLVFVQLWCLSCWWFAVFLGLFEMNKPTIGDRPLVKGGLRRSNSLFLAGVYGLRFLVGPLMSDHGLSVCCLFFFFPGGRGVLFMFSGGLQQANGCRVALSKLTGSDLTKSFPALVHFQGSYRRSPFSCEKIWTFLTFWCCLPHFCEACNSESFGQPRCCCLSLRQKRIRVQFPPKGEGGGGVLSSFIQLSS